MRPTLRLVFVAASIVALAACSPAGSPTASSPGAASGGPATATPASAPPATSGAGSPAAAACQSTTNTGGVAVNIEGFAFSPGTIEAKVGQPITWTNADSARHGAALDDGSCTTGSFGKGGSGSLVFSQPGTYTYHCPVHTTSMTGTIEVKP